MSQRGTYSAQPSLTCPEVDRVPGRDARHSRIDAPETGGHVREGDRGMPASARGARRRPRRLQHDRELRRPRGPAGVALGIEQWNVFGISYGTDYALTYMRLHPEGIRSVGIDGIFPPPLAGGVSTWTERRRGDQRGLRAHATRRPALPRALRRHRRDVPRARAEVRAEPGDRDGKRARRSRPGERDDQRRHARAVGRVAGHAHRGGGSRRDRRARPWRRDARRDDLGRVRGSIPPASVSSATGSSTASRAASGCPTRARRASKPRASARFRRFRPRSTGTRLTSSSCAPTATSGTCRRSIGRSATSRRAASRRSSSRRSTTHRPRRRSAPLVARTLPNATVVEIPNVAHVAFGEPVARRQRMRAEHRPRLLRGPERGRHELCNHGCRRRTS